MSTSTHATPARGRPRLSWLTADEIADLPRGTAVAVETRGRHSARLVGRVDAPVGDDLQLVTPRGPVALRAEQIRRGRLVGSLYDPGDAVLLRGTPASIWRGGVVRTSGSDVLVEQIDGTFAWLHESDLEPADARTPEPPRLRRGPVPAVR